MQSRFSKIVDEVEAELRGFDHSSPHFTLLRPNFVDDLMRIRGLHRRGAMLEIGGYPFYFSMCLQRLGVDPTTVDLAPERAQNLIRKHSLRVVTCDIERESLPFADSFAREPDNLRALCRNQTVLTPEAPWPRSERPGHE